MAPDALALSTPAYARLRERLRREILAGEWVAGEHRTLSRLAAEHGVSISPVREALLGLEGEGLVEMRQHRGAVVPVLDARLVGDLYDLRGSLQALFARRAAERITAAQITEMIRQEEAYASATARGDVDAALVANDAFHELAVTAADNPQAAALFRSRSAFVNTVRLRVGFGTGRAEEAVAQHAEIRAAIASRDPEAAAAAAFGHAMAAKRDLLARLNEETNQ
ncbi:GntR family transcriptional regulator [Roseomonas sp. CAU 1739]|uniref:GntR family transcriptional regulator n=1 Tax=Roseomonas sp. CAU 1739 TaxID=3140364 RepID=UPI00325ABA76